jgi:hypothetical protein
MPAVPFREAAFTSTTERVAEVDHQVTMADSIDGRFLILRKGRKRYHLVRILHKTRAASHQTQG